MRWKIVDRFFSTAVVVKMLSVFPIDVVCHKLHQTSSLQMHAGDYVIS